MEDLVILSKLVSGGRQGGKKRNLLTTRRNTAY